MPNNLAPNFHDLLFALANPGQPSLQQREEMRLDQQDREQEQLADYEAAQWQKEQDDVHL